MGELSTCAATFLAKIRSARGGSNVNIFVWSSKINTQILLCVVKYVLIALLSSWAFLTSFILSNKTKSIFIPIPLLMSSQIYAINTFLFTIKCLSSSFLPADQSVSLLLKTSYPACSNSFLPDLVYSTVLYLLLSLFHFRGRMQLLSGSHLLSAMWETDSYLGLNGLGVKFWFYCQIAMENKRWRGDHSNSNQTWHPLKKVTRGVSFFSWQQAAGESPGASLASFQSSLGFGNGLARTHFSFCLGPNGCGCMVSEKMSSGTWLETDEIGYEKLPAML